MRIVNRKEFLKLPEGTLFNKFAPCIFGDLAVKGETWSNDFWCVPLNDNVDCNDSGEFADILFSAVEKGTPFKMDYNIEDRDGMFDEEQLFAIYDKDDVKRLLDKVTKVYQGMK